LYRVSRALSWNCNAQATPETPWFSLINAY
jgi:hypothetical protein